VSAEDRCRPFLWDHVRTCPRATYPDGEPDIALRRFRFRERPALPSLFGFAPGVVCHAGSVAGPAGRSYRTFSPLPPPERRRFVLCGTFPGVTPAGCYPAPYVDGARTFLPRSLSTIAGAAAQHTDALRLK